MMEPSRQFHPNINHYRDGGMGGVGENHSVVGMVPTHILQAMHGNSTNSEGVARHRAAIQSGEGFKDPAMVIFDHKKGIAVLGEGNHRVDAAAAEGHSHVPVRVVRGGVNPDTYTRQGGNPAPVHPGASPWKGGMGEDYWPSDIHPKYLWPHEDVK